MVQWIEGNSQVSYPDALEKMDQIVKDLQNKTGPETIWLLEHPPLYTAGTSANLESDVKDLQGVPLYQTGRGGKITYHGPGQRVGYVMLDLKQRKPDVRKFVKDMEEWIIKTLALFDVKAERREGRIGLWVSENGQESKIAAIGVRIQKWVTYHGFSLNINPDLTYFNRIVPCGIQEFGVTSLEQLGVNATVSDINAALKSTFSEVFETCQPYPLPTKSA